MLESAVHNNRLTCYFCRNHFSGPSWDVQTISHSLRVGAGDPKRSSWRDSLRLVELAGRGWS